MAIFAYAQLQLSPREILKVMCILEPVIHSGDIRLVLISLQNQVMSFQPQNKNVLLSAAPPVRKTLLELARLVLIVCRQFVNYAIALKFCNNMCNSRTYKRVSSRVSIQPLIKNELYYFISFIFLRAPVTRTLLR